jgi:hypothetical protein
MTRKVYYHDRQRLTAPAIPVRALRAPALLDVQPGRIASAFLKQSVSTSSIDVDRRV